VKSSKFINYSNRHVPKLPLFYGTYTKAKKSSSPNTLPSFLCLFVPCLKPKKLNKKVAIENKMNIKKNIQAKFPNMPNGKRPKILNLKKKKNQVVEGPTPEKNSR